MLVQTNNNIQGVVAANDNIAGAVVATLKAKGLKPIALSRAGRDRPGRPEHHLGLADEHRLQVRARRGERGSCRSGRAVQGQEAPKTNATRPNGSKKQPTLRDPGCVDHQGELHAALHGQVPEAERRVLRGVQAVLQVDRRRGWRRLRVPPLSSRRTRPVSDTPLLEIRDLSKTFGSVQALTDVDFEVRAGEVMALVGDNGAGKSTLIKCIAGIHGYDSGEIVFDGEPVHDPRAEGRGEARDRGRLPGSRAVRQPRRRPEHVPRP